MENKVKIRVKSSVIPGGSPLEVSLEVTGLDDKIEDLKTIVSSAAMKATESLVARIFYAGVLALYDKKED